MTLFLKLFIFYFIYGDLYFIFCIFNINLYEFYANIVILFKKFVIDVEKL
jgi:hypothetical protein